MARRSLFEASILLLAELGAGAGGDPSHGHPAAEPGPASSPAPPAPLFDDLGSHAHAVTTKSDRAQRYFDQGLRLVYAFNHEEAERSFREAARLDPGCAMAFWGVALSLGPNINLPIDASRNRSASEAIQRALPLASRVSEPEAAYINALSLRYSIDPGADRGALDRAYAQAMREVSRRYPDDLDAATLFAESLMDLRPWHLWTLDGKPEEGTEEIVSVLESVLRRSPNHPGANHYYIHAVEASPHPERALANRRAEDPDLQFRGRDQPVLPLRRSHGASGGQLCGPRPFHRGVDVQGQGSEAGRSLHLPAPGLMPPPWPAGPACRPARRGKVPLPPCLPLKTT